MSTISLMNIENQRIKERSKKESMKQTKHREDSPVATDVDLPLSPITARQKNDFKFRQLHNDVIVRARSTFLNLSDVWRAKNTPSALTHSITAGEAVPSPSSTTPSPTTPPSPGGTKQLARRTQNFLNNSKTLDFFLWSKSNNNNSTSSGGKPKKEKAGKTSNYGNENNNNNCPPETEGNENNLNLAQKAQTKSRTSFFGSKGKEKAVSVDCKSETSVKEKRKLKYLRNRSLDQENEDIKVTQVLSEELRHSWDDGINKSEPEEMYSTEETKPAPRPKSFNECLLQYSIDDANRTSRNSDSPRSPATPKHILFNEEDDIFFFRAHNKKNNSMPKRADPAPHLKEIVGILATKPKLNKSVENVYDEKPTKITNDQNVVKARLRLHQINETLTATMAPRKVSQGSSQSASSASTSSSSFPDKFFSPTIFEELEHENENWDISPPTPQKKISFNEPDFESNNINFKSETLPRTKKLQKQNELPSQSSSTNSGDGKLESQAMRIVRTVGQAFEVCHKLSVNQNNSLDQDDRSETPCDTSEHDRCSEPLTDDDEPKKDPLPLTPELPLTRPNHLDIFSMAPINPSMKSLSANSDKSPTTPLSTSREIQLLREQLEQQSLQTRQALAQLMMVREQLISESNARMEAQTRTQQLMQQNRELLEHIASLGNYNEPDRPGLTSASMGIAPQLSSTAKVARWFAQLPWNPPSLSRPESGFVSGDSRSERNHKSDGEVDHQSAKEHDIEQDFTDEFFLVEGTRNIWSKLSVKKRKKLLSLKLGKVTTF